MSPRYGDYGLFDNYEDYRSFEDLWDRSAAESDYYADLEDYQQRELYNQFAQITYDGNYDAMVELLDELGITWDETDWDDWRDAYAAA